MCETNLLKTLCLNDNTVFKLLKDDNRNILNEGFVINISKILDFKSFEYIYLIYFLNINLEHKQLISFQKHFLKTYNKFNSKTFFIFYLFAILSNKNKNIHYKNIEVNEVLKTMICERIDFEYETKNEIIKVTNYKNVLKHVIIKPIFKNGLECEFYY